VYQTSPGRRLFVALNTSFLIFLSVACVFPVVHELAISFSSGPSISAGEVTAWPVDFTLEAYRYMLDQKAFFTALGVTVQRVVLGTLFGIVMTLLLAYPLSKEGILRFRAAYVWYFVLTILFSGGLIPSYLIVKNLGMLDSIWALVLPAGPGALAAMIFHVVLVLNFFRGLPKELEEAAFIDGAGYWTSLWRIYAPLSMPVVATVVLFVLVFHWNAWFDGLIYMNSPKHYPLSSYLQTVIINVDLSNLDADQAKVFEIVSQRNTKAAQIFLSIMPVMAIYPFLQKYLIKGVMIGGIKE